MKSWDCFDTIIGRKHFHPRSVFNEVAKKINDPSFVQKRINAEKSSRLKTYEDIYKILRFYDPNIEIETEIEQTFPIKQNFDQIQDGDIIVSDMYLSADQIERILRSHGLTKDITIHVSPKGKMNGSMWQKLNLIHNIELHTGDNIKSDIVSARKNGIKSLYFPGKTFTRNEKIASSFCPQLAYIMRAVRLSCPYQQNNNIFLFDNGSFQEIHSGEWIEEKSGQTYPWKFLSFLNDSMFLQKPNNYQNTINIDSNNITKFNNILYNGYWQSNKFMVVNKEKTMWNDQTQYNIPALISTAQLLPKDKKLIFTERDCWYLKLIYDTLYARNSDMLHVSRKSYRHPYNEQYKKYIIDQTRDGIIVDIHGSGQSPSIFFDSVRSYQNFIYVCFRPINEYIEKYSFINIDCLMKENDFRKSSGRAFEKFNIHNIGPLLGWNNKAIRSRVLENTQDTAIPQSLAINKCLEYLPFYQITTNIDVLKTFVSMMPNTYTNKIIKLS
jgi:hypothetical protein